MHFIIIIIIIIIINKLIHVIRISALTFMVSTGTFDFIFL